MISWHVIYFQQNICWNVDVKCWCVSHQVKNKSWPLQCNCNQQASAVDPYSRWCENRVSSCVGTRVAHYQCAHTFLKYLGHQINSQSGHLMYKKLQMLVWPHLWRMHDWFHLVKSCLVTGITEFMLKNLLYANLKCGKNDKPTRCWWILDNYHQIVFSNM